MASLAVRRLCAQRLIGQPFGAAPETVRGLGAVQSQDYGAAKWALGMRVANATDALIDRDADAGRILRTHVLRPTWHFVHPDDIRWMLALTGPRIMRGMPGRHRRLGIDTQTINRSFDVFTAALGGGSTGTRADLGSALQAEGISPEGQRLPHLLMAAELHGLLVSGPRRGKQFTWALLEERVAPAPVLEQHDAVVELTKRYFQSHGPATLYDFAWWSGVSVADARNGIAAAGKALSRETLDGVDHWSSGVDSDAIPRASNIVHLLPNFDEYTVAYRDRSAALDPAHPIDLSSLSFGSVLANVVIVGGRVIAAWRRTQVRDAVLVEIRPFGHVSPRTRAAVSEEAQRMSRFLERNVRLRWG